MNTVKSKVCLPSQYSRITKNYFSRNNCFTFVIIMIKTINYELATNISLLIVVYLSFSALWDFRHSDWTTINDVQIRGGQQWVAYHITEHVTDTA